MVSVVLKNIPPSTSLNTSLIFFLPLNRFHLCLQRSSGWQDIICSCTLLSLPPLFLGHLMCKEGGRGTGTSHVLRRRKRDRNKSFFLLWPLWSSPQSCPCFSNINSLSMLSVFQAYKYWLWGRRSYEFLGSPVEAGVLVEDPFWIFLFPVSHSLTKPCPHTLLLLGISLLHCLQDGSTWLFFRDIHLTHTKLMQKSFLVKLWLVSCSKATSLIPFFFLSSERFRRQVTQQSILIYFQSWDEIVVTLLC